MTLDYTPTCPVFQKSLGGRETVKNYMDDSTVKLNNSSLLKQCFEPRGFCCQAPHVMYSVLFGVCSPMYTTVHSNVMLL